MTKRSNTYKTFTREFKLEAVQGFGVRPYILHIWIQ
jgi:hypothetical protein